MTNSLNPVDVQRLFLLLLGKLDSSMLFGLSNRMELDPPDASVKAHVLRCISFANTKQQRADYCSTFEQTCKTIIARQKNKEESETRKYEVTEAMGFGAKNYEQFDRGVYGEYEMKLANIQKLCNGFALDEDKQFWKYLLLSFLSKSAYIESEREGDVVSVGLKYVLQRLPKEACDQVVKSLKDSDQELLKCLEDSSEILPPGNRLGEPPLALYTVIEKLRKEKGMSLEKLALDVIGISETKTFEGWKSKWDEATRSNFSYIPRARIKRNHLLRISLAFDLNYVETTMLLQLGGYRLGSSKEDQRLIRFFLEHVGDRDELLISL